MYLIMRDVDDRMSGHFYLETVQSDMIFDTNMGRDPAHKAAAGERILGKQT